MDNNIPAQNPNTAAQPTPNHAVDFFIARQLGFGDRTISEYGEMQGLPVVLNSIDFYRQKFPDVGEQQLNDLYSRSVREYRDLQLNNYNERVSTWTQRSTLNDNEEFRRLGYPTIVNPVGEIERGRPDIYHIPGGGGLTVETMSRDQVARRMPVMLDQDNNVVPNTWKNRFGLGVEIIENPDPNSPVRYLYKRHPLSAERLVQENVKSIFGTQRMQTSVAGTVLPLSGLASGSIGLGANFLSALTQQIGDLTQQIFDPEGFETYERTGFTATANSLSNIGAAFSHANADQQVSPFRDLSSLTFNTFNMFGQIMGMHAVVRGSVAAGAGPRIAPQLGIMFMSGGAAANIYNVALESGASPGDAAAMFWAHALTTFAASNVLRANILQNASARRVIQANADEIGKINKGWAGAPGVPLPSQISEHVAGQGAKLFSRNWAKAIKDFTKQGGTVSKFVEKSTPARLLTGAAEEGFEEIIENVGYTQLARYFNRNVFIPQARSIVKEHNLNGFDYFIEEDQYGLPVYYRRSRNGTKTPLLYNVWKQEQEDLSKAKNVLDGNLPLDEQIRLDEAVVAAIGSFFGGGAIHFLSGAHQARAHNDEKLLVETVSLQIAELSPNQRKKALDDIRRLLNQQQKEHQIFGPDHLDNMGNVVKADSESTPVSKLAIDTFINDVTLTLDLIESSRIKDPSILAAIKGNRYLQIEAVSRLKAITALKTAIQQKTENQPITQYEGLFTSDATIEQLQGFLKGQQEAFSEIINPKAKGQTSLRYSKMALDYKINDYFVDAEAERRSLEYFRSLYKNPNYVPVPNDKTFLAEKARQLEQVRNDPNTMFFLTLTKDPIRVLDLYNWDNVGTDVYDFLAHSYRVNLQSEMDIEADLHNQRFDEAQKTAFNNTALEDLISNVRMVGQVDLARRTDTKFTQEDKTNFQAELDHLKRTIRDLIDINRLSPYSQEIAQKTGLYGQAYHEALDMLKDLLTQSATVANTEGISSDALQNAVEFGNQAETLIKEIEDVNAELNLGTGGVGVASLGKRISDLNTESPEIQTMIRKKAIEAMLQVTPRGNIKKTNTISLHAALEEIKNQLEQNNELVKPEIIIERIKFFKKNAEYIKTLVKLQTDFLQNLKGDDAQHAILDRKKESHLFFTKEERDDIVSRADSYISQFDAMLESEKLKEHSRDFAHFKEAVRLIEIRHFHAQEAFEHLGKELDGKKELEAIRAAYKKVGELLDTTAGKKIGEGNGFLQYRIWVDEFHAMGGDELADKEVLKNAINTVESALVELEVLFGGKLGNFMLEKKKEMIAKHTRGFNDLGDFIEEEPADFASSKIDGAYSAKRFADSLATPLPSKVYYWSVITWANINNRQGIQLNGKNIPSIKDISRAYRKVLEKRQPTEKEINDRVIRRESDIHVSTYAQERAIIELITFINNPDQKIFIDPKDNDFIPNSYFLRAYAGAGKTKQLLVDLYQTLDTLKGESVGITVVSPTKWLDQDHKNNFDIVNKIENVDYNIIRPLDIQEGKAEFKNIVIFDDASVLSGEWLLTHKEKFKDKLTIWLGDEAQTPNLVLDEVTLPVKRRTLERSRPLTEIFRSGNTDHFKMDDNNRSLAMGILKHHVSVKYKDTKEFGLQGARYYANKDELRDAFVREWERTSEEDRTAKRLIYVVLDDSDIVEFHRFLQSKYNNNEDAISAIMANVFTSTYDIKDPNRSAIGIGAHKVFYEFDREHAVQRISKMKGGNYKSLATAPQGIKANVGRLEYTGVSRRKTFIGQIGDPKLSEVGEPHHFVLESNFYDKKVSREKAISRLRTVYGDHIAAASHAQGTTPTEVPTIDQAAPDVTEETPVVGTPETAVISPESVVEPVFDARNVFDRSVQLTDESRDRILNSEEFKGLSKQIVDVNRKLVDDPNSGLNKELATNLAVKAAGIDTNRIEDQSARIRRARNKMLTGILRYHYSRESLHLNQVFVQMDVINSIYREIDANHHNIINNKNDVFFRIYNSIASSPEFVVTDQLSIVGPSIIVKDATIISDNKEQTVDLVASPAVMKVVGLDKDGNAIVDILEFAVYADEKSMKEKPEAYTKSKIAMYIAMANQSTFKVGNEEKKIKVNRVFVSNYYDAFGTLEYGGTHQVSDGDAIEYLKSLETIYPAVKNLADKDGNIFAGEMALFANERIVENKDIQPGTSYYRGDRLNRDRVFVTHVTKRIIGNNNAIEIVHFENDERVASTMLISEFLKSYQSASSEEALSENQLFNSRAITHTETGAIMSHALVFSPLELSGTKSYNSLTTSPIWRSRMVLLGKIDQKQPVIRQYHPKLSVIQYDKVTGKALSLSAEHVVTNQLSDEYLQSNQDLVRDTLRDANIEGHDLKNFADVLKIFKDYYFHILSYDNEPEAGFTSKNSLVRGNLGLGHIGNYLTGAVGSNQHNQAFDSLAQIIKIQFDPNDHNYNDLVNYNLEKLRSLKEAYDAAAANQTVYGNINQIKIGNHKKSDVYRRGTLFVEHMTKMGFQHGAPYKITNRFGRFYFGIDFTRPGIPGKVTVEFDARSITLQEIRDLKKSLTEFIDNNQALKDHEASINKQLSKPIAEFTNEDWELLRATANRGYRMFESEPAFQFLAANLSNLKKIETTINQIILEKLENATNRDLTHTGSFFRTDARGLHIIGDSATQRAKNARHVLTALISILNNRTKFEGVELDLRVDPFYTLGLEESEGTTDTKISIDALQTKTELVKAPEIYVISQTRNNQVLENEVRVDQDPAIQEEPSWEKGVPALTAEDLNEYNSSSVEAHLSDIRQIIGEGGAKYGIKLETFNLQGKNGVVVYGALYDRMIKLYGKEINGRQMYLKNVGRHEAMHFVMNYLLDRKSYNSIMNEVAAKLGIENNKANEVTIHEYIADSFMTMETIKKPETLWERFVQALKEIINYLGIYTFTYNEMMVAADAGFFAKLNLNPQANTEVSELYSSSHSSKWSRPEVVDAAIAKVGDREIYDAIKNFYLVPKYRANLPIGKRMNYYSSDPASAMYMTVKDMIKWQQKEGLSERRHLVNGVLKAVKEFTPNDVKHLMRLNMNDPFKQYAVYALNDRSTIMTMMQEFFPHLNVQEMYATGKDIVRNQKKKTSFQQNISGEIEAHAAETKSYANSITDILDFMLSTVPYYRYEKAEYLKQVQEEPLVLSFPQVKPTIREGVEEPELSTVWVMLDNTNLINSIDSILAVNPDITAEQLSAELKQRGIIERICPDGGGITAEDGIRGKFHKGFEWEIVKDLKGYPSHAQGGVDVRIGKDGFSFIRGEGEIKAAHGLVLPASMAEYADDGTVVSELWERETGTPWRSAREQGLTTGTYEENMALRRRLVAGEFRQQAGQQQTEQAGDLNTEQSAQNAPSFSDAFRIARVKYGPDNIFEYRGQKFATNFEGEAFNPSIEILEKHNLNKPEVIEAIAKQNIALQRTSQPKQHASTPAVAQPSAPVVAEQPQHQPTQTLPKFKPFDIKGFRKNPFAFNFEEGKQNLIDSSRVEQTPQPQVHGQPSQPQATQPDSSPTVDQTQPSTQILPEPMINPFEPFRHQEIHAGYFRQGNRHLRAKLSNQETFRIAQEQHNQGIQEEQQTIQPEPQQPVSATPAQRVVISDLFALPEPLRQDALFNRFRQEDIATRLSDHARPQTTVDNRGGIPTPMQTEQQRSSAIEFNRAAFRQPAPFLNDKQIQEPLTNQPPTALPEFEFGSFRMVPEGSRPTPVDDKADMQDNAFARWEDIAKENKRLNSLPPIEMIAEFNRNNNDLYLILDRKLAKLHLYRAGKLLKSIPAGSGRVFSDRQTSPKHLSTGAGVYTVSFVDPRHPDFGHAPSYRFYNERGIEVPTVLHAGNSNRDRLMSDNDPTNDRFTAGCIAGHCFNLHEIYNLGFGPGHKLYVLPVEEENKLEVVNNRIALRSVASLEERELLNITPATHIGNYIPIRVRANEQLIRRTAGERLDLNDIKEFRKHTVPFMKALETNKQRIMNDFNIDGDSYNEIARVAFGIYGVESSYGDDHGLIENIIRSARKLGVETAQSVAGKRNLDKTIKDVPGADFRFEATNLMDMAVPRERRSIGPTQIVWNQTDEPERNALAAYNITDPVQLTDPYTAALATMIILVQRYHNQLTVSKRRDILSNLPQTFNRGPNYTERVKRAARALIIEQAVPRN